MGSTQQKGQEYLIKWYGYRHSDNTWEPEQSIFDSEVIRMYWAEKKSKHTNCISSEASKIPNGACIAGSKRSHNSTIKETNGACNDHQNDLSDIGCCVKNYVAKSEHTAGAHMTSSEFWRVCQAMFPLSEYDTSVHKLWIVQVLFLLFGHAVGILSHMRRWYTLKD